MTDELRNPDKDLALLSLSLITEVAEEHMGSPGMHQVRLLSSDLHGLIESDVLMVTNPVEQIAVPVTDPEPWPVIPENAPFWYPSDPGPNATRAIADLMVQIAHRPIPLHEAANHYRSIMVHVGEAVSDGSHSTAAIVIEQPAEGKVNMQPIPAQPDTFKSMQPAPPMPVQLPKGPLPPLFAPGHPPLDLIGRLRSMIYDRTGIDIGVDYAKRVLADIAGDAGKDTTLLNALERATKGSGVDRVEVRLDRTVIQFTDTGKMPDVWVGTPREALKRIAGIQKPD